MARYSNRLAKVGDCRIRPGGGGGGVTRRVFSLNKVIAIHVHAPKLNDEDCMEETGLQ